MTDAPSRPHGCWVILAGNTPTSFRARAREVLVPTFVQLRRTQPDVSLKWFERGRIWTSPAEARDALLAQRQQPRRREHPPDWRPGGDHKDPRKRFELSRDQKRARFKTRQRGGPGGARGRPAESDQGPDRPKSEGGSANRGREGKSWPSRPGPGGSARPGGNQSGPGARWPSRPRPHGPSSGSGSRQPPSRHGGGPGRSGQRKPGGSRGPR
jgi:hypothetical protein